MSQMSTILIVDDDPRGRETLQALLVAHGYQLAFASNGAEALAQAQAQPPDLILLDVMMPVMDGFEVCRRLRADPLLAEVPVIMVTALDDRDSRLQGIEAGADDFISKPFDRAELRTRVRTITRLNRYRHLLHQRARFEWVVDQADDGYLVVDARGFVLYANERARLYLGISSAEGPCGETFLALAGKQYRCEPHAEWTSWLAQPAGESPAPRYLVRPASANANTFLLQVDLLEMTSGADERYLVRLRDATARVINQNAVWTFQGLLRHKLSSSLTQLLGALRLIEGLRLASSDRREADLFTIALNGAARLQSDILDIFQYMNAPDLIKPKLGRCNLAKVPSIISQIGGNLELPSISVDFTDIPHPDSLWLAISSHGVELILSELIENAQKFHPDASPIIDVALARVADTIHLHIRDEGQTLSPDQLAKAWLPYYQGERYFSGQVPGMGLGLPMVAALIWRVGGSCRIYNREPGPGIGVELIVPLAQHNGAHHG